jgi:beta-lactamase regulating signal transducer with metallopeptidase domain
MMSDLLRNLLALTLVSSVSILIVLSTRQLVRRAFGAAVAYRAWLLVPVSMLALFIPGARDAGYELVIQAQVSPVSSLVTESLGASLGSAESSGSWQTWLMSAWVAGVALFIAYIVGLQRAFVRGLGRLSDLNGTLRAETAAGCPALIGVLRPKVVLPGDFETRYTAQEQSLILAHENVHLMRLDSLWNALTALLRSVFWFNPLMHAAAARMRVDQELACDAAVIERHPASRRTYAGAMLKTQLADAALPVGCHWTSTHPFKERLEMIKTDIPTRARRAFGGGVLAIASALVGYAAWAAEPALAPIQLAAQSDMQPAEQTAQPAQPATQAAQPDEQAGAQPAVQLPELGPGPPGAIRFTVRRGPNEDGPVRPKGVARFSGDVPLEMAATTVTPGPNGQQTLEGNVSIVIRKPAGIPGQTKSFRRTPDGDVITRSQAPDTVTLKAEKVVITPQENGDVLLEWENGNVFMQAAPQ